MISRSILGIMAILALIFLSFSSLYAHSPAFAKKAYIMAGGRKLDVREDAAPRLVDWNEDGKKDLILGNYDGYVLLYLNSGTNEDPVFTTMDTVKAKGFPIRVGEG